MLNQLKRSLSLISGLILCINSVWLLSQGQRHFAIALSIFIGVALILSALFFCKRPLNPMSIFNSVQVSSGVAVILLFGSLYGSAIFSAHHLNRHMDPTHSALLTGLKS